LGKEQARSVVQGIREENRSYTRHCDAKEHEKLRKVAPLNLNVINCRGNILDGGDGYVGKQGGWGKRRRVPNIPGIQAMMEKG